MASRRAIFQHRVFPDPESGRLILTSTTPAFQWSIIDSRRLALMKPLADTAITIMRHAMTTYDVPGHYPSARH
jgi:hypothetical protein